MTELSLTEISRVLEDRLGAARSDLETSMLSKPTVQNISDIFDEIETYTTEMAKGLLHAIEMTEHKITEQQVFSLRANVSWLADFSATLTEATDHIAEKKVVALAELNEFDERILERVFVSNAGKILDTVKVESNAKEVRRVPLAILELLENKGAARVGIYPEYIEVSLLRKGREVLLSKGGRVVRMVTHYLRAFVRNIKALFVGAILAIFGQNLQSILETLISVFFL